MTEKKKYNIEYCQHYIEKNIEGNLTTDLLAQSMGYSASHFKRLFTEHYKMTVSDYIRKKRLSLIAEKIRSGMNYMKAGPRYGFTTVAGLNRAFQKEYLVLPAAYAKAAREEIDVTKYDSTNTDTLSVLIVRTGSINVCARYLFESEKEEMDFQVVADYWNENRFLLGKRNRGICNRDNRDDIVGIWHHYEGDLALKYYLGPVVKSFEDSADNVLNLTLGGGKYAIFQTSRESDVDCIPETLRLFEQCILKGWVKEHSAELDLERLAFERYVNDKVYYYVPLKEADLKV